ncbi:esterase/lipase family protein [Jeotgalibacillus haloalkalitolerans]|uniref:Triacylglycerol lipase n=1 Tax=Jeotgalibacillus haloalkalitolerans TaxID=3104292 RepID=A0ABU5KI58_9BACL|nr:hypothetical protein [Jeotgalibacillus sp. HH7-29]MDZ5710818.1 hypothetical protein [Jeotgalibacillus sp. HH7-29]
MKKTLSLLIAVFLLLSLPSAAFAGGFKTPGNSLVPGTISIGEAPAYIDPAKPVVVFVQGLTNDSTVWYNENDMYSRALAAGYETAFVELNDSGGTPKSYWDNGEMLAGQLEEISAHFGGKKLVIVAFSKGGVDTQVALIHEGKYPLVSNVITLSSPHYGSELANLANSTSLGWLASLIGQNSEGTQSLQTGTMNYFRSITDNRFEASQNSYFSLAGTRTGPLFSAYWFGSGFISGPNDGVVSVASAQLPYGRSLAVGNWNHGEVNKGYNTLSIFQPYLTTQRAAAFSDFSAMEAREDETGPLDTLIRGGAQDGKASESFYVEDEAESLVINWMSATPHNTVTLKSPKGPARDYEVTADEDDTMFFDGAYHHTIEVSDPEAGKWIAETVTEEESAYALMVTFQSTLNDQLALEPAGNKRSWALEANLGLRNKAQRHAEIEMFSEIGFIPGNGKGNQRSGQQMRTFKQSGKSVTIPSEEGTYNMTVEVEGTTPSGQKFQRTVIESVFVDKEGFAY